MTRVAWRHCDDRVRHQPAERLIDIHVLNRVFAEVVAEHLLDNSSVRQALHDRALARRHLAGHRTIDGVFSVCDRGNMSNRLLRNRSHVTGERTALQCRFLQDVSPLRSRFLHRRARGSRYWVVWRAPPALPKTPPPLPLTPSPPAHFQSPPIALPPGPP